MRTSAVLFVASMSLVLGGCAWQTKEAPKAAPVAAAAHPVAGTQLASNDSGNPDQVICRHEEITGSRLEGRRVCLTRYQWAQRKQESLDQLKMLGKTTPQ